MFYDKLETRSPDEREAALMNALARQVAHAKANAPFFAASLKDVRPQDLVSRAALARLPVLRKSELLELQRDGRKPDVFGGVSAIGRGGKHRARRIFASPGPIYEPEGSGVDHWRMARALYAAGFRDGELIHNSFSHHLTPAGSMIDAAAQALGCSVFPAGVGNTEIQLQAAQDLRPDGYAGTPSLLRILVEKAESLGMGPLSMSKALVSGEAFPKSVAAWLQERGVNAYQCYATADVGLIAYETPAREGLVLDEHVIVEIVRPGSGDPVSDGEVGEVVVTALNPDYPLIRFGTGDLSAILPGCCPTGRTNTRIRGWLGRADQTAKVRGMFVHPFHVADVMRRHPEVLKARLVVSGSMANDTMLLQIETDAPLEGLAPRVAETVREVTRLRCDIELVPRGRLPNDGRMIEDSRTH
jgi:phenylacetate-CoA ligase